MTSMTIAAALATVLVVACGGGGERLAVVTTRIDDLGPIFRRAQVTLSVAAAVEVEYWAASGPRLRVVSARGTQHAIALPRLRERGSYQYRVRAVDGGDEAIAEGSFATGELPADLRAVTFTPSGQGSVDLVFLSLRSTFNGGVIVDHEGHVVWYARTAAPPLGAARRTDGHWVLMQGGAALSEFSPLGERVAELAQARLGAETMHHDLTATPWNTLLLLAFEPRLIGGQTVSGETLWEWDPATDALAKRWSAFDHLDPALDAGARSVPEDWWHANSISFGPRGNVLVSLHHLDQVISIAPGFGPIEWRLGGVRATLATSPEQAISGPHSVREVALHRVLLFDNGFERADGSRWSRAIELAIDPLSGAVQTAWEYRPDPPIWARIVSSARRLANGHSLITFGTPAGTLGASGPVALHEVSAAGERLWTLTVGLAQGLVFQGDAIASIGGETVVP